MRASSAGNLTASGSTTDTLDLSAKLQATIQVKVTPTGTVQAGAQTNIFVYPMVDNTNASTVAITSPSIPSVASTAASLPIVLPGGEKYTIKCTNTDTVNTTTLEILYDQIDGIS